MSYTVGGAFDAFRKQTVDLDPDDTKTARASRTYLEDQVKALAANNAGFPRLSGPARPYGSFARRTKIQPLDDIDLLLGLNEKGLRVQQSPNNLYTYWLKIEDSTAPLASYPDGYGYVNSTKVLNAIKFYLSKVPNYSKAEIKKNGQAVTLKLSTRTWAFDLVPSVAVARSDGTTAYFLIPDGAGNWIRTDPRIDDANTTRCNGQHGGLFLPTIRLLKYWNRRVHKPRLRPYYFETLAINTFSNVATISSFPAAVRHFFDVGPAYLQSSCADPKGLGPALDSDIDRETKNKVYTAMADAAKKAAAAIASERREQHREAIALWGQIFGPGFPSYGS